MKDNLYNSLSIKTGPRIYHMETGYISMCVDSSVHVTSENYFLNLSTTSIYIWMWTSLSLHQVISNHNDEHTKLGLFE